MVCCFSYWVTCGEIRCLYSAVPFIYRSLARLVTEELVIRHVAPTFRVIHVSALGAACLTFNCHKPAVTLAVVVAKQCSLTATERTRLYLIAFTHRSAPLISAPQQGQKLKVFSKNVSLPTRYPHFEHSTKNTGG